MSFDFHFAPCATFCFVTLIQSSLCFSVLPTQPSSPLSPRRVFPLRGTSLHSLPSPQSFAFTFTYLTLCRTLHEASSLLPPHQPGSSTATKASLSLSVWIPDTLAGFVSGLLLVNASVRDFLLLFLAPSFLAHHSLERYTHMQSAVRSLTVTLVQP